MNWALLIIYIFVFLGLLINANQHGKPKDNWNFWTSLICYVIELTLIWWALGWRFI